MEGRGAFDGDFGYFNGKIPHMRAYVRDSQISQLAFKKKISKKKVVSDMKKMKLRLA